MASGTLSYSQLKGVWLDASKGTKYHTNAWASVMAAIAESQSSGDPLVTNPNDNNGTQTSWGLWQISNGTHSAPGADWGNPAGNARLAIGKLNSQGLTAWGTYDSGAYKAFLSGKTAPDFTLANMPSSVDQGAATSEAQSSQSCAWGIDLLNFNPGFLGFHPLGSAGKVCILSKPQARALIGVGLLGFGGMITLTGVNWVIVAAAGPKILQVAGMVLGPEAAAPGKALARRAGARIRSGP